MKPMKHPTSPACRPVAAPALLAATLTVGLASLLPLPPKVVAGTATGQLLTQTVLRQAVAAQIALPATLPAVAPVADPAPLAAHLATPVADPAPPAAKLLAVRKIWDAAPHNAFTDLVRFRDRWYCAFREGKAHVSAGGAIRILTSADGQEWTSVALFRNDKGDLRDAKLAITPRGELMAVAAVAWHQRQPHSHQTFAWFSEDGQRWSEPVPIGEPDVWLWRVTWHGPRCYGIGYSTTKDRFIRLYVSEDGRTFATLVPRLYETGYPNETSIAFDGDTAYCLLRRDGQPSSGLLGIARPPYKQWEWKDLGVRIGGPHMLRLPDGRWVAAVRLYDKKVRTALCWLDPEGGRLSEFLTLPSGGDTSYAGLVWHQDRLWVSYYSSHEGKTSIYLAQVAFPAGR